MPEHVFSNSKETRQDILALAEKPEELKNIKPEQPINPKRGLVIKLAEVMAAVGYTQKTGWNEAQKYHYVTEADIAEKIRPELARRNLVIFPTMMKHERTRMERIKYDKPSVSYATDVLMRWTIVDGDTGDKMECDIPGCSESPGDKGVYVAMTGSEKYLLMKLFLLPTGDDPEDDSNEPVSAKDQEKERKTQKAKEVGAAKVATAKNGASLFYIWNDSSQIATIQGDEGLKKANRDLLSPLWDGGIREIVANADQLEALKYELEQRKVPFSPLKAS